MGGGRVKERIFIRLDRMMEKMVGIHYFLVMGTGLLIASPFIVIYYLCKYIGGKVRRKAPKKEHITPSKDKDFLFSEKRKIDIPHDKLVYVEAEYSEKMHRFFEENAEWLAKWQRWHGWDIAEYSSEDIKEGMLYPQDFAVFRHGFLWHAPFSTWDRESDISGAVHYYYEIDPDSATPIKEQMELLMRKLYKKFDIF